MDSTPDATRRFLLGMTSPEESHLFEKEWLAQGADETVLVQLSLDDTFTLAFRGLSSLANDPVELVELMQRLSRLHAESTSRAALASEPVAPPTRLGVYQIQRELGRGGMGTVYEAIDTRLDRTVALKILNPERSDSPEARARFLNEARAAANLESDHIVAVYDVGEYEGQLYFTMPCLKGQSLKDYIDQETRLPWQDAVRIGRQIALGLSAAHAQGIAHRDIKPENIWLEETDSTKEKRARILDFGIARFAENVEGNRTREGMILGTPAYMAPEQARGERGDERSDLFSLGVILYRMVTGQLPFQGDNILAILSSLAIDVPKPAHELDPTIPKPLSNLIQSLIAKNPSQRPQKASDVVAILNSPLDRDSTLMTDPRSTGLSLLRRLLMLAACLAIPSLIAGVAFYVSAGATVRVEINDPNIVVTFKGDNLTVQGATEREIRLRPGEHRLVVNYNDLQFETSSFVLKRGDQTTLKIDRLPDELNVLRDGTLIDHLPIRTQNSANPWKHGAGKGVYLMSSKVNISARDLPFPINGDFTLEAFVTPALDYSKGGPQLFDVDGLCKFMVNFEGKWSFYTFHDLMVCPVSVKQNRRVHLAGVRTPKGKRLYVDGKLVEQSNYYNPRLTPFENVMRFVDDFEGTLEQIRFSDVARYRSDFVPSPTFVADENTIALYPCDEGQGTILHDRSKHRNHLKIESVDEVFEETPPP